MMGALREVLQKPDPPRASETPYYDRYIGARPTVVTGRGGALCATKEVRGVRFFFVAIPQSATVVRFAARVIVRVSFFRWPWTSNSQCSASLPRLPPPNPVETY
jgi:hypothetical protein